VKKAEFSTVSQEQYSANNEPTHFDDLIGEHSIENSIEKPIEMRLQKDDFHKMFLTGFSIAHNLTGYRSLQVENDNQSAKDCANALYECIEDIPALHFLLKPQNKWFDRAITIGAFTVPMAISVANERHLRKQPVDKKSQENKQESFEEITKPTDDGTPSADLAQALGA